MGFVKNIKHDKFPKQGQSLNQRVKVVFYRDTSNILLGEIVRDDMEDPLITIIRLDNGRYVLSKECQFSQQ